MIKKYLSKPYGENGKMKLFHATVASLFLILISPITILTLVIATILTGKWKLWWIQLKLWHRGFKVIWDGTEKDVDQLAFDIWNGSIFD